MTPQSMITRTDIRMPNINLDINMSEQEWLSDEEDEAEGEEGEEDEDKGEGKEEKPEVCLVEDFWCDHL